MIGYPKKNKYKKINHEVRDTLKSLTKTVNQCKTNHCFASPWIINALEQQNVKSNFLTINTEECAKIAYFQHAYITKWIHKNIKELFSHHVDKESIFIEDSEMEDSEIFEEHLNLSISFLHDINNTHFINPLGIISGVFLLTNLLQKVGQCTFEDFHKFIVGCLILSSKMYEDDYVTTKGFFKGLRLSKWGLDLETVIFFEVEVWKMLEYNIYVNEEEVERFFIKTKYDQKNSNKNSLS